MLNDLNRVDFHNVQEQAAWVCKCDKHLVDQFEAEFKKTLHEQNGLENWAKWLGSVVDRVLSTRLGGDFVQSARHFLLAWSFYSSMVIRDLTLRSAASFGSFHLIRLLYDEFMFFLVEHRVAKHLDISPVAVSVLGLDLGPQDQASQTSPSRVSRRQCRLSQSQTLFFSVFRNRQRKRQSFHRTLTKMVGIETAK